MQYINATEILPETLIKEIQKYTSGTLLYIPTESESKSWGELSGYRQKLLKRNQMIVNRFQHGEKIPELSEKYCLSIETIKRIVYTKKNVIQTFHPSVESAKDYEEAGMLEEWLHTYLLYERKNIAFSDGLLQAQRYYIGPIDMPVDLFSRNSGPEEDMKWRVHQDIFESNVTKCMERIRKQEELPPLIVNYEGGVFEMSSNNPLLEALKRMGKKVYAVIVWNTEKTDYETFCKRYAEYLCQK